MKSNSNFQMQQDIDQIPEMQQKEFLKEALERIKKTKVNVLLIGGTGVGKSSTVNALFQTNGMDAKAEIGQSANPQTMDINSYSFNNIVIWDTPGLGDSAEKDQVHQAKIIDLLKCNDDRGSPLIDLILLILDGGSRDFSSAYKLIREVVSPNLQADDKNRLLIGINKADRVMSHHFWDVKENAPKEELIKKLEEQSLVVKKRIENDTGFSPDVVYYSAGEIHDGELLLPPYNLAKLLSFIIDRLPQKKRASIARDINENKGNFQSNDKNEDYGNKIENSIFESIKATVLEVAKEATGFAVNITKKIANDPEVIEKITKMGVAFFKEFLDKKKK